MSRHCNIRVGAKLNNYLIFMKKNNYNKRSDKNKIAVAQIVWLTFHRVKNNCNKISDKHEVVITWCFNCSVGTVISKRIKMHRLNQCFFTTVP